MSAADHDDESIALPTGLRVLGGIIAVALLTVCVIMVWQGRDGAAVVALIVTGGLAGLLALAGSLPSRLVIGGNEAHWRKRYSEERQQRQAAEVEVEAVAEALPPESLKEVAERADAALNDDSTAPPRARRQSALSDYKAYQDRTLSLLLAAAKKIGADTELGPVAKMVSDGPGTFRAILPDALVTFESQRIVVDVRRVVHDNMVFMQRDATRNSDVPMLIIAANAKNRFYRDNPEGRINLAVCGDNVEDIQTALSEILRDWIERHR